MRRVLRDPRLAEGQPAPELRVVPGFRSNNYQRRHFADVLEAAKLEGYTPRDLRATFATHLVTAGVPIAEVGDLLGHADAGITAAKHYGRFVRGYDPIQREPGELAVDPIERALAAPAEVTPVVTPLPGSAS